jgi:glycosyltransferase involved in cell wall biosynthesis
VKKGLLIFPILKDLNKADGILVKNEGIRKGFLQNKIDLDVLEFTTQGVFNGAQRIFPFSSNRYRRIYQYHLKLWKRISDYITPKKYDFIWFRIPVISPPISRFVESLKNKAPDCKIILEYGAYPFVNELTLVRKAMYLMNRHHEKKVHRLADFVITYSGQRAVDGVINIPIDNGIDLDDVPMIGRTEQRISRLNFISVSSLKKWHAYERFIYGMADYINSRRTIPVHFNIVGNGPEYEKLRDLVNDLRLQEHVTFHGFKTGPELDSIYEQSHIAVGTLGFHRIGITKSSSLKNREYFARGLPVVLSTPDKDMPAELAFVKYVSAGEEPVNVEQLVDFAHRVYSTPALHQSIRSYASRSLSWASKIKTVLHYLSDSIDKEMITQAHENSLNMTRSN